MSKRGLQRMQSVDTMKRDFAHELSHAVNEKNLDGVHSILQKATMQRIDVHDLCVERYALDGKSIVSRTVQTSKGDPGLIELIRRHGVDITVPIGPQKTSLAHSAVVANDKRLLKYFIRQCGVSVNSTDIESQTPLHYVIKCTEGSIEILKTLLKHKADVNAVDRHGCTPLHHAMDNMIYNAKQKIKLLLQYKADVNLQDNEGNTTLHTLLLNLPPAQIVSIAQMLHKCNPNINKLNNENQTAYDILVDREHQFGDTGNGEEFKLLTKMIFPISEPRESRSASVPYPTVGHNDAPLRSSHRRMSSFDMMKYNLRSSLKRLSISSSRSNSRRGSLLSQGSPGEGDEDSDDDLMDIEDRLRIARQFGSTFSLTAQSLSREGSVKGDSDGEEKSDNSGDKDEANEPGDDLDGSSSGFGKKFSTATIVNDPRSRSSTFIEAPSIDSLELGAQKVAEWKIMEEMSEVTPKEEELNDKPIGQSEENKTQDGLVPRLDATSGVAVGSQRVNVPETVPQIVITMEDHSNHDPSSPQLQVGCRERSESAENSDNYSVNSFSRDADDESSDSNNQTNSDVEATAPNDSVVPNPGPMNVMITPPNDSGNQQLNFPRCSLDSELDFLSRRPSYNGSGAPIGITVSVEDYEIVLNHHYNIKDEMSRQIQLFIDLNHMNCIIQTEDSYEIHEVLAVCMSRKHFKLAQELISQIEQGNLNMFVNKRDRQGWAAVHYAAKHGKLDMLIRLKALKASLLRKTRRTEGAHDNWQPETVRSIAQDNNHIDIVNYINKQHNIPSTLTA